MSANHSNIFTETDEIQHKLVTILVETFTPIGGEALVVILTVEGKYDTREKFMKARKYATEGWGRNYTRDRDERKICGSINLRLPGTRRLIDSLKEALEASEEV